MRKNKMRQPLQLKLAKLWQERNLLWQEKHSLQKQVNTLENELVKLIRERQEIYAKLCELLGEPLGPIDILEKLAKFGEVKNARTGNNQN